MPVYDSFDGTTDIQPTQNSTFWDWLNKKGTEFTEKYTANNPYSYTGMKALEDEITAKDTSALETAYNNSNIGVNFNDLMTQYQNGEISATDFQRMVASLGIKLSNSQLDWLETALSQQMTQEEYDRGIQSIYDTMEATQKASAEAGLNSSAYLMSQGAAANNGISKAQAGMDATRQQNNMEFARKTEMAKSMLSIVGGMARSGIYGGSVAAAKAAIRGLSKSASNNAMASLKPSKKKKQEEEEDPSIEFNRLMAQL